MFGKTTMVALSAAAALACAGASFGGTGHTEGPFLDSFGDTTDWGVQNPVNLTVPQFDEMGGLRMLTKVTIEWNAGVAGNARVESLDVAPSTITATLAASITIDGPSGFSENPMPSDNRNFPASAFDGTIDFGGASGVTFDEIEAGAMGMRMFTAPGDLFPFIGVGTVDFPATATATSTASGPGNVVQQFMTDASAGIAITYEYIEVPQICNYPADVEPNDHCEPESLAGSCSTVDIGLCGKFIDGKLEKRIAQGCEPDTYLVLFDKQNNILDKDDNGSDKGNGWGSGIFGIADGTGIIDNGDGTRSIRIGVTGRADGLDLVFNGLFQNAAHGQIGKFRLDVRFLDAEHMEMVSPILPQGGGPINGTVSYYDEFVTGAEAFYINYILPQGAAYVDVCIDNQIACEEIREDVDFFCLENLVPLCDYCITQVGGLDCECIPTATAIGWFDKSCELILKEQGNLPVPGYTQLCVVADANGRVVFAISGANDCNFNGLHDEHEVETPYDRAPVECEFIDWGHGVAGCYTLCVEAFGVHAGGTEPPVMGNGNAAAEAEAIEFALDHGDLNRDNVTNTADLGILLGNFGWSGN